MKKGFWISIAIIGISIFLIRSVGARNSDPSAQEMDVMAVNSPSPQPTATMSPSASATPYMTPTQDAALMAQITLVFAQATDTQVAIAKTEHAMETSVAEIKIAQTAQATQTLGMQTVVATKTQGAETANAMVMQTESAATQQIFEAQVRSKKVGTWSGVIFLILCGLLFLAWIASKVWGAWKMQKAQYLQASQIAPDKDGRFSAVPSSALGKDETLINLNLAHRTTVHQKADDLSTEQALWNAQANRQLEATRAITNSPAMLRQMMRNQAKAGDDASPSPVTIREENNLLLKAPISTPSFSMVNDWDGKGGIPCGLSANGMELVDMLRVPHGGVFGKTGTGKSRRFLRTFTAGAIAAGLRVVILGKSADFFPFADHPNVKIIAIRHITEPSEAARYAEYLKRMVEEMNRRDEYLTDHHISTWDRAGREGTLIVLDELGNALDMMPRDVAPEALRWVKGLTKEGRKYGLNVWMASQRAVGFKSIVEQLGRAVFHLADADASRHALGFPGAEDLLEGQFFAKFNQVKKCVAFDPSDDELTAFLRARPVKALEPVEWIDGKVVGEGSPSVVLSSAQDETKIESGADDVDRRIRVRLAEMIATGSVSLSQVEREIYGDARGGAQFRRVQRIYQEMKGKSPTTTGNMPGSEPLAA